MKTFYLRFLLGWVLFFALTTAQLQAARPSVLADGKTEICVGENVIVRLTGTYPWYNWSTGSKAPVTEIRGEMPGIFRVHCIVIDFEGQTQFSDTLIVTVRPRPRVPAVAFSAAEQLLEAASADPVQWYFKPGSGPTEKIAGAVSRLYRPQRPGTYFAEAFSEYGCTTRSADIFVCLRPQIRTVGNRSFCLGGKLLLEVPEFYPNYKWSTGQTEQAVIFEPRRPGIYSLYCTVSSPTCVERSEAVTVEVLPLPPVPRVVQKDRQTLAARASGFYTFSWLEGQNDGISDTARSLSNDSLFRPRKTGTYYVVIRNTAGCASASIPFNFRVVPASAGDKMEKNFLVFPQPAKEELNIRTVGSPFEQVELYDLSGKLVKTFDRVVPSETLTLQTDDLNEGLYLLKIKEVSGSVQTLKVFIQK